MKTLSLMASKGGVGKSTLAVHLAVEAQSPRRRVAIYDADPQGSAARWWHLRASDAPALEQGDVNGLTAAQERAAAAGVDLLIVDSAPSHVELTGTIVAASGFTLIPARPALFDLDGVRTTVEAVSGSPAAVVFNACPPGRGVGESSTTIAARAAMAASPVPLCPVSVTQRAAFGHALNDGRAVTEFDPDSKAAKEISDLWEWIRRRM